MADLLGLLVPSEFDQRGPIAQALGRASVAVRDARPSSVALIDVSFRPRAFSVPRIAMVREAAGSFQTPADVELQSLLYETAIDYGLPTVHESAPLTKGAAAALQALSPRMDLPVLSLGVPTASPSLLNEFGQALRQSAAELGRRLIAIAVGALARDPDAQQRGTENPAVQQFGREVLERLEGGSAEQIFEIDGALWIQGRPEAELGHLSLLLGFTTPDAEVEVLGSEASSNVFSAVLALRAPKPLPPASFGPWEVTQHPTPQG